MLAFVIAVLAGIGCEVCCLRWRERRVQAVGVAASGVLLIVLALMWHRVATARFFDTARRTRHRAPLRCALPACCGRRRCSES